MKTFNVYEHPDQGFKAVKEGFSWPAVFLGILWILEKKLWSAAVLWFIAYVFIETIAERPPEGENWMLVYSAVFAASLALWLIPGFKGNQWWAESLLKRGYRQLGVVQAKKPNNAIANSITVNEGGDSTIVDEDADEDIWRPIHPT